MHWWNILQFNCIRCFHIHYLIQDETFSFPLRVLLNPQRVISSPHYLSSLYTLHLSHCGRIKMATDSLKLLWRSRFQSPWIWVCSGASALEPGSFYFLSLGTLTQGTLSCHKRSVTTLRALRWRDHMERPRDDAEMDHSCWILAKLYIYEHKKWL